VLRAGVIESHCLRLWLLFEAARVCLCVCVPGWVRVAAVLEQRRELLRTSLIERVGHVLALVFFVLRQEVEERRELVGLGSGNDFVEFLRDYCAIRAEGERNGVSITQHIQ
jgi:hypothetical protein